MWKCPECERVFKTKNQSHSCVKMELDDLFLDKPQCIRQMYEKILSECSKFCKLTTDTTRSCIYFVDVERFLVVKPQKMGIILEFVLNRKYDVFPVIKIYDLGKGRYAHRLKLDDPREINAQVIHWIEDAHKLLSSKD
jgi:hypothetical protein